MRFMTWMKSHRMDETKVKSLNGTVAFLIVLLVLAVQDAMAAPWQGIEPLRSRRADVERILGKPLGAASDAATELRFRIVGGRVTVTFVTPRFIETKRLDPNLAGTVLQVVVDYDNAADTPQSLGIQNDANFAREERGPIAIYRNQREGIVYSFLNGRLRRAYYSPSAEQLSRAQRR
ncbi:MAG: hypothetical protein C4334_11140 [Pyrinomonas sp.]